MPNDIVQQQNTPKFLAYLAASSRAYDILRKKLVIQRTLAIASGVGGAVTPTQFADPKGRSAALAMGVVILDRALFDKTLQRSSDLGARIQERFDCELLRISWNECRAGSKVDTDEVNILANKFRKKHDESELRDWYPKVVERIPLEYAVLVCQRVSMSWDLALRRHYSLLCGLSLLALILIGVAIAVIRDWTIRETALLLLPYVPFGLMLHREYEANKQSADRTDSAKSHLTKTWRSATAGDQLNATLAETSRCLQDQLFDRRKSTLPVPQWFYRLSRTRYEESMDAIAVELVAEVETGMENGLIQGGG